MWDWGGWQPYADYGARYDIGLIEIHPGLIRKLDVHRRREPSIGFIGSVLWKPETCRLPPRTELFWQDAWDTVWGALRGKKL